MNEEQKDAPTEKNTVAVLPAEEIFSVHSPTCPHCGAPLFVHATYTHDNGLVSDFNTPMNDIDRVENTAVRQTWRWNAVHMANSHNHYTYISVLNITPQDVKERRYEIVCPNCKYKHDDNMFTLFVEILQTRIAQLNDGRAGHVRFKCRHCGHKDLYEQYTVPVYRHVDDIRRTPKKPGECIFPLTPADEFTYDDEVADDDADWSNGSKSTYSCGNCSHVWYSLQECANDGNFVCDPSEPVESSTT